MSDRRPRWLVVSGLLCLLSGPMIVGQSGSDLARSSSARGVEARLAVRGDAVLVAVQADVLMSPGSVAKLVLATTLLHRLGPDHRLRTRCSSRLPPVDGILAGDLVVHPAGDPSWRRMGSGGTPSPIVQLARRLQASGLRRVEGDLVVAGWRFPGRSLPSSRAVSEVSYAYGAPTSGLALDGNAVAVEIAPGARVGAPGKLRWVEPADGLVVENEIRTVGAHRRDKGTVDFFPVWGTSKILAIGEYPRNEPAYRIELSVPDPDARAARALLWALGEAGVEVEGKARVDFDLVSTPVELAYLDSPTIAEMLRPVLLDSDNWSAEMLLRALAAEETGEGRSDSGLDIERRFLEESVGLPAGWFELDDASGLSPYSLITPRATVELLRFAWRQPWRRVFAGLMATPGKGTLAAWGPLPPLQAKTGTLRNAVALAGWLPPRGGDAEPLIFAGFINHRPGDRESLRAELRRFVRSLR